MLFFGKERGRVAVGAEEKKNHSPSSLTRLVFKRFKNRSDAEQTLLSAPSSAWSFPTLRHLDVRGFVPAIMEDGQLEAVPNLPLLALLP